MTGDKKIPYAALAQEEAPPSYSTVASTSLAPFNQQPVNLPSLSLDSGREGGTDISVSLWDRLLLIKCRSEVLGTRVSTTELQNQLTL